MLIPMLTALPPVASPLWVTIGTYTTPNGSQGIYEAPLDTSSGALGQPVLRAEVPNPSFVAFSASGKFAYAVHEFTGGEASAYAIGADRKWTRLNAMTWAGGGPCHLSVSANGKALLTADYGKGTFASLTIQPDGSLGKVASVHQMVGSGPDKGRQEGPHAHAIVPDPKLPVVYGCDLGTDTVAAFSMAPSGALTFQPDLSAKTVPGGGPRHIALHPNGKWAYVNNEMLSSVSRFDRDTKTGKLTLKGTLPTLPAGAKANGNSTAEIFLHPNGKYVYVTNRGHDSIAIYSILDSGDLSLVEVMPAGVKVPRGCAIDPTGNWVVVAGQGSNDVVSMKVDTRTGRLSAAGHRISVSQPVCVVIR